MLEVYLVPRPSSGAASAPATPAATPSAPTPGSGSHAREDAPAARVWTIVDGVLDSGLMAGALRRCCKVLDDRRPLQRLVLLVQVRRSGTEFRRDVRLAPQVSGMSAAVPQSTAGARQRLALVMPSDPPNTAKCAALSVETHVLTLH